MWRMSALFSLLLVLVLVVFNNFLLHYLAKEVSYSYFVVMWSTAVRSFCQPSYGKVAENFSVHGLWPNDEFGEPIWDCNPKDKFNESKVSTLISDMEKFWPSISCPPTNSRKFWSHEWSKHGTCSGLNQFDYFDRTLKLKNKANILKALENAEIKPGNSSYTLVKIKKAIEAEIGFSPIIKCQKDLLKEVYICVDKTTSNFIPCPQVAAPSECLEPVKFPFYNETVKFPFLP